MQTQAAIPTISNPPSAPSALVPKRGWPSVAELSARLYGAYEVEGGGVHLAGCTLEPQAIVEISGQWIPSAPDIISTDSDDFGAISSKSQNISAFATVTGEPIDEETATVLGLHELVPCEKPPRAAPSELALWKRTAQRVLEELCRKRGGQLVAGSTTEQIIWCRRAAGKLRFSIGGHSVDQSFDDWAATLTPPRFVCSLTGRSTFHLAATADGRVVAAEEIAPCAQTGRRMLRQELATCSATGKKVSPDLVARCPVTMRPVLKEHLTVCPICKMQVSPAALTAGRCRACSNTASVRKDDPRLCLVFGEFPGLDRWRRWRMAETQEAYVMEASGILRQLLVVMDKRTLQPTRLAERARFQADWADLPPERWREYLE